MTQLIATIVFFILNLIICITCIKLSLYLEDKGSLPKKYIWIIQNLLPIVIMLASLAYIFITYAA